METKSMKQHMGMRAANTISNTVIHVLLVIISVIWLVPFVCIVLQSLRVESTWQVGYILPKRFRCGSRPGDYGDASTSRGLV